MNFPTFFITMIMLPLTLLAGIEQCFKPCPNKGDNHSIKGIDFIYMINLDQREEKFLMSSEQLNPYHVYPYRFSAVNGWELTNEQLNSLGVTFDKGMDGSMMGTRYPPDNDGQPLHEKMKVGTNYYSHCMSRGAVGICLSHLSILYDAWKSGYKTIWIMEDDVEVIQDPNTISKYTKELDRLVGKKNWDILFTDPDTKNKNGEYIPCLGYAKRPNFSPMNPERFMKSEKISKNFTKKYARYGAYSMIVKRSGMKKILQFLLKNQIFLPYDMEFYLPHDINMYSLTFDLVSTMPDALSDNGGPRYQLKENLKK